MTEPEKRKQLTKYKALATGLFVLMVCIFILSTYFQKHTSYVWLGYLHAFSEAAMVGALADWFAVTALFHYPMGIKIPHTNLIENSKQKIGNNLGDFVVENFVSAENLRPPIERMKISEYLSAWLIKDKNQKELIGEVFILLRSIVHQFNDQEIKHFISSKIEEVGNHIKINHILGNSILYLLEKEEQQPLISLLSSKIKFYILENQSFIQEKVRQNSSTLIPKFVKHTIAHKIVVGLADFFEDIEKNENHQVRVEISSNLYQLTHELMTSNRWEGELNKIKKSFLHKEKLDKYATDIWNSIRQTLLEELNNEDSKMRTYARKNIQKWVVSFSQNKLQQSKIDRWMRFHIYRISLKNRVKVSELIRTTVANWEGRQLSQKLELEVGKDLQFIRVNGTLVGGLVGVIIYTLVHFMN
ncbi:DUF445 family protein [Elizabethkingia argentiflava]|uniref:DUF445 family protein n=1 Tax=Elizabethkingia argenteiflava TaxID=2681556 RepID=A0A845PW10_9FLAO|nr:DUF445 domain-containing protein [Elizabethkingia argenteiflava]NAW50647.1 DUF445 family protein [Elizabethkingia argenteiflava]